MSFPIDPSPGGTHGPDASGSPVRPTIPDSVKIASELWIVVVVGQIVAFFAQYPAIAESLRDSFRDGSSGVSAEQMEFATSAGFIISVLVVVAAVLSALPLVAVWFARRGYGWARVVAAAMGVYVTVDMVWAFFAGRDPVWAMVPTVISGVAALGATILLMRADSDKYCRAMAEFRKPRPVAPPTYPYPYPQGPYYGQAHHGAVPPYGPGVSYQQVPPSSPPYGDVEPGDEHSISEHPTPGGENNEGRRASDQS